MSEHKYKRNIVNGIPDIFYTLLGSAVPETLKKIKTAFPSHKVKSRSIKDESIVWMEPDLSNHERIKLDSIVEADRGKYVEIPDEEIIDPDEISNEDPVWNAAKIKGKPVSGDPQSGKALTYDEEEDSIVFSDFVTPESLEAQKDQSKWNASKIKGMEITGTPGDGKSLVYREETNSLNYEEPQEKQIIDVESKKNIWNAGKINGIPVDAAPKDGQLLRYNKSLNKYECIDDVSHLIIPQSPMCFTSGEGNDTKSYVQTNDTTWLVLTYFYYKGTAAWVLRGLRMLVSGYNLDGQTAYVRFWDRNNRKQIAILSWNSDSVQEIGTSELQNLPIEGAWIEVQIKVSKSEAKARIHSLDLMTGEYITLQNPEGN